MILQQVLTYFALVASLSGCGISGATDSLKTEGREVYYTMSVPDAVQFGSFEAVKEAVQSGGDVNATIDTALCGESPKLISVYEYAVAEGGFAYPQIAQYLLENGLNLNHLFTTGFSPLMVAAASGNVSDCEKLIQLGADVNLNTSDGKTALYLAARAGQEDTVRYLMSVGAVPTTETLHSALKDILNEGDFRNYKTIRFLTQELQKAGVAVPLDPIIKAAILGQSDEVVRLSKSVAVPADKLNWLGYNVAAFCNTQALNACVSKGFSLYQYEEFKQPIEIATKYGNLENVKWMVENWGKYSQEPIRYPLNNAATNRQYDIVEYLLRVGAPIETQEFTESPLFSAARNGDVKMVKRLLQFKQDWPHDLLFSAANQATGINAVINAGADQAASALEALLAAEPFTTEEMQQLLRMSGSIEQMKLCVQYGADPKDFFGLQLNSQHGETQMVEYMLQMGLDTNQATEDSPIDPPLLSAVNYGFYDIAKLLIAHGVDVNFDYRGYFPLQTAAMSSSNLTRLLLDNGADVNMVSKNGDTPLMSAIERGNVGTAKMLISAGTDISIKNADGKTALDLAKASKKSDIQALFS